MTRDPFLPATAPLDIILAATADAANASVGPGYAAEAVLPPWLDRTGRDVGAMLHEISGMSNCTCHARQSHSARSAMLGDRR
ncbi:hypothetical protein [Sphingomonas turrisvirgatae]|uniref:Uncharacterized protein n=1 Tax=Sphingomonas turrisvirgatae TaxID=1888892 RepID=A0A1E3LVL7_9SPHN|nr:hypothetical protein [Sphingomonas turrisvirgatae]ODP36850.1 hypothetical protein BFL28_03830 [Sphingomonas turrisvirgatae]